MRLNERIGRRVKLQDLNVLLTAIQAGSMSKAAERLHTGQPSISRAIAHLEKVFGARLLERHHEGIEPTEYGRALLDCGLAVFDDLRRGVENIEFLLNPDVGEVRIGCPPVLGAGFVTAVITRASKRHPGMVFRLTTDYPDGLYEALKARQVDLLIARRTGKLVDDQLDFHFLFNDSYVVAADSSSPWFRRRNVQLADLIENASWVLAPPESVTGSMTEQALRRCGLGLPRATVLAGPVEVRMNLVRSGRFLSIFSTSALTFLDHRHKIRKLPVTLPGAEIENGILVLKGRTLNPIAHRFMKWAEDVARPLARRSV